ncbi:hypothetical protein GGC65_002107 [Sphingopyxis sp. OAS728]|uniref:hypothetical protein n=1 Tax=Sphingopyxis sp. OAS728 TaxID=2663823 RepID=UPI001789C4E6|nr:hypothetical protein [Sphingopyxis sp. OAS728]MBE1527651.1 hypothetical protein [Sphingopyxis sp. OAS728]
MEESREFLTLRRAEAQAAAACAMSEDERTLHRELADYYAQRLAQMANPGSAKGGATPNF